MNFAEYIGLNNPEGVNRVLIKNGYTPCNYVEDCPNAIDLLMHEKGANATEDFLREHPDYEMIVGLHENDHPAKVVEEKTVSASVTPPIVSSSIPVPVLSDSLKEILVIIMAFWLLNKIISN